METNKNESKRAPNLWDSKKAVLRGKSKAIQDCPKKQEKAQINNLSLQLKDLEKEKEIRLQTKRRKDIIKMRVEIYDIGTKKIQQTNTTRRWFLDRIKKIGKPLARLIKRKEREDLNKQNQK